MRLIDKRPKLSRRGFLAASGGATLGAALITTAGSVAAPNGAWAMEVKALKPRTMATLIQLARDIYPHDRVADRYYAKAVKGHDETAAQDSKHRELMESGVADLDARAGSGGYIGLGWEANRVAILRDIEETAFFQNVRGGLVVGLYNQKELWPLFGYEGESAAQGGYLERGFDDIDWV